MMLSNFSLAINHRDTDLLFRLAFRASNFFLHHTRVALEIGCCKKFKTVFRYLHAKVFFRSFEENKKKVVYKHTPLHSDIMSRGEIR